jgi:hypothetical protein
MFPLFSNRAFQGVEIPESCSLRNKAMRRTVELITN